MKIPKWKIVLSELERKPFVTNIDIIRIASTTCPHDIIRTLRRRGVNVCDRTPIGAHHKEYFLVEV